MFYGNFPEDIVANDNMEFICMHHNVLTGTISDRIGFLKNLKSFDVSFNRLTGTIPDTIKDLSNLQYLTTSGNNFSPQPLMDLSGLSKLQDLSMKGNNLTGRLPGELGFMTTLQMLDLDGNHLTGSIPTYFGMMYSLNHLLLNRNKLSGSIPSQLSNLKSLKVLLLDGNDITGSARAICDAPMEILHFVADCYPSQDGSGPEVDCRCCTVCCSDDDPQCNNKAWTSSYNPKYEFGYIRQEYGYSLDQAPEGWSKKVKEEAMATSTNQSTNDSGN
jgi:hypothetical protein